MQKSANESREHWRIVIQFRRLTSYSYIIYIYILIYIYITSAFAHFSMLDPKVFYTKMAFACFCHDCLIKFQTPGQWHDLLFLFIAGLAPLAWAWTSPATRKRKREKHRDQGAAVPAMPESDVHLLEVTLWILPQGLVLVDPITVHRLWKVPKALLLASFWKTAAIAVRVWVRLCLRPRRNGCWSSLRFQAWLSWAANWHGVSKLVFSK